LSKAVVLFCDLPALCGLLKPPKPVESIICALCLHLHPAGVVSSVPETARGRRGKTREGKGKRLLSEGSKLSELSTAQAFRAHLCAGC